MLIIPAIDLKDGQVVRYTRGKLNKKVYSDNPVAVALSWQGQGAKFLHLVDLDGAILGQQKNLNIIKKIIKAIKIPAEVSGGIRELLTIKKIIAFGATRVSLGTKAIENLDFLKKAIEKFGNRIVLSLDASNEKLGLYGWRKSSKIGLRPFLEKLKELHPATIIYTDISRDGTLSGVNIPAIKKMLKATPADLIVSGGVSSLADIKKLVKLGCPGLKGVIVGKALYERRFTLKEAIAATR